MPAQSAHLFRRKPVTAKGTGPQGHIGPEMTDWLLPFKGTAGGDVSPNKRTSKRNNAKPAQGHILGHKYQI